MAVEKLPGAQHTTYAVQIVHTHSEGIVASPIAGKAPKNASLVRWHAPFEMMSVYWTVVSEGKPPLAPSHKIFFQNGNRAFLGGERVGVVYPNIVGHIFQMAGVLHFCVVAPEGLDSEFDLSKCPWEQTSLSDFCIPAANFLDTGIVNPNWHQPPGILPDSDVPILNLQAAISG